MKALENLAVKLGMKSVSLLLLLIACGLAFSGINSLYQEQVKLRVAGSEQSSQQQAQLTVSLLQQKVVLLQSTLRAAAELTELQLKSKPGSSDALDEKALLGLFPGAEKACIVDANIAQPTETACLSISFATLNSIRQAKTEGLAPIAVMQAGKEQAHLLLAHRLDSGNQSSSKVLLVAYPRSYLQSLLPNEINDQAYIELQQGTKRVSVISRRGNMGLKQGQADFRTTLDSSYWHIAYWAQKESNSPIPWQVLLMVLGGFVLCWFVKDSWGYLLLILDKNSLNQQIDDLKNNKMKPDYQLSSGQLDEVKENIRTIAYERKLNKPSSSIAVETSDVDVKEINSIDDAAEESIAVNERLFGPYDIRETKHDKLDQKTIRLIGAALGSEAKDQGQQVLVVARDDKLANEQLAQSLIDGIMAAGCDVLDIGAVASPLFFYACETLDSPSGVMITTSSLHQQAITIKTILNNRALTEDALRGLYTRIDQKRFHSGSGNKQTKSVLDDYIKAMADDISIARPIRVVIDCGNAIAGLVAPKLFQTLGCDVITLNCDVGGQQTGYLANPNHDENFIGLIKQVQQQEAELGIAFDGDGDRLLVVDSEGRVITPDRLMVLFAQSVLVQDPEATILYDVKSTNLIEKVTSRAGGKSIMSRSGYAIIKNKAHGIGAKLAGEYAGHIYFNDRWFGFEDALYTAARLLEFISNDPLERSPTEVFAALPQRFSTTELFVEMGTEAADFVTEMQNQAEFSGAHIEKVDGLRVEFPDCWGLIRLSNTQQRLSLRFEANSEQALENIKQQFRQQMLQIKPTLRLSF
jgi:phosphomannomutase/phosphoglucomutase